MLINNFKSLEELSKQDYLVYDDLAESIGRINNPLLHLPLKNNLDMICGDGTVTFTRSTTATYVDRYGTVKSSAINAARFEKEGLLIEGGSTNKCLYSEDLTDSNWYKARTTISSNVITAPNGTTTADGLIANTENNSHATYRATSTSSSTISFSIFAKKGNKNWIALRIRLVDSSYNMLKDKLCYFDIVNGIIGNSDDVDIKNIVKCSNDYFRCEMTLVYTGSTTVAHAYTYAYSAEGNGNNMFIGDGSTVNTYFWGAQVEEMPFATSYIPTTTAAVTRAKDVFYVTYAENMPDYANEFSVLTDFDKLGEGIDYDKVFRLQNAPVYVQVNIGTDTLYVLNTGVVYQNSINFNQLYRIGLTYNKSISAFYIDGNLKGTSTPSPIASGTGEIYIGNGDSGIQQLFGHISNFRIYDIALTEKEMRIA